MLRRLLPILLMLPLLLGAAEPVSVPRVTDLQALGAEARARNLPILVMFSSEHCPYCMVVREEFLKPMLRSGDYTQRVIIVEIESDETPLIDFDVVFLDAEGRELAPRLVGITTVDFYGGYLDEAIDTALLRLRKLALQP